MTSTTETQALVERARRELHTYGRVGKQTSSDLLIALISQSTKITALKAKLAEVMDPDMPHLWRFRSPAGRGWSPWQLGPVPDDLGDWLQKHEIQEVGARRLVEESNNG